MKLFTALFLIFSGVAVAQPVLELTPSGFAAVLVERPPLPDERLMELSQSWPAFFYKGREPYDVYDVTATSLKIDGFRDNAFHYRNLGEVFQYRIKYTMEIGFTASAIEVKYTVKEIYADRNITKLTVADFFAPDGRLKDDYREAKPSLEMTMTKLLRSYIGFINR